MKKVKFMIAAAMMTVACGTVRAAEGNELGDNAHNAEVKSHRVLVMGIQDNVTSNYFVKDMLAENTDIKEDSVCYIYNKVIEDNLSAMAKKAKSEWAFVTDKDNDNEWQKLLENVRTVGEAENRSSDLAFVNKDNLQELLADAGASYLLLLDSHYLKYQEVPFKTVFHYVNYSLYDANKQKLAQGSNYFTSINPQTEGQMIKSSRKSAAKMVDAVENILQTK